MKRTMTIRIGFAFLPVIFLLLSAPWPGQMAAVKEMVLPSAAQQDQQPPRDTQAPLVAITTPARDSSHNLFPAISGTVEDKEQPGPTPQQTIPPSGVARVLVVIYSYDNQKYWNGAGWINTNDPLGFALPARLSGSTWTLDAGLPSGDALNLGKYFVAAIAFDNANNRGDGYTEIYIDRFFITLWDANAAFTNQLDFSDNHETIADTSLAKLAAQFYNLRYSLAWLDPAQGRREAAVADGTTKILVMVEGHTPGALNLRRRFDGIRPVGEDALTQVNSHAAPENIYPIASVDNHYLWLALYTVPDGIEKSEDFLGLQQLEFTATMNGGRKQDSSISSLFSLKSPPVLIVHGIWSSSKIWGEEGGPLLNELQKAGLDFYLADYSGVNTNRLKANHHAILNNTGLRDAEEERRCSEVGCVDDIEDILNEYRNGAIACTQVDVVGHSAGGLLVRQFLSPAYYPIYRNKKNFGKGYIRRLITVNTPHLGTRLANIFYPLGQNPIIGPLAVCPASKFLRIPFCTALFEELQVGSSALRDLGQTDVPSFAITSNVDPRGQVWDSLLVNLHKIHRLLGPSITGSDLATINSFYEYLFPTQESDGLVSTESQRGGLPRSFTDMHPFVFHTKTKGEAPIGIKIASLLRSPRQAFADGFPAPFLYFPSPLNMTEASTANSTEQSVHTDARVSESRALQIAPIIDLASPIEDAAFSLFTPVPLTLRPMNSANIQAALVMVDQGTLILPNRGVSAEPSPVELLEGSELTAPLLLFPTSSGRIQIKVFARDDHGNFGEVTRTIFVRGDSPLLVNPPLLELPAGEAQQLTVIAFNQGGTIDDITGDETGTRYESSNTNIVTVNQKGLVTAISRGNANIVIRNGERQTSVAVTVIGKLPSLFEITPDRIEAGTSSATLAIKGFNLKGAIRVEFWHNGKLDRALMANNLQFQTNELHDTLTVNLQIAANAGSGSRTVVVTTQGGASDSAPRAGNGLMIEANERPPLPAPKITAIDPTAKEAGGAQFSLIVNGSGFVATSQVMWNGAPRATVYESPTRLRATIQAADIGKPGTASVMVANPSDSGGASNTVTFNVLQPNNPVPALTQVSPNSATAGSANLTLTVMGRNFVNGAKVRWNGADRTTSFISSGELKATILASDIASPNSASVTVFNPMPGGGVSNGAPFTILPPDNPIPTITQLSPSSITAGSAGFTLTITGRNFVNAAKARWNGIEKTTSFVSATELKTAISAADVMTPGVTSITVFNPAPGGGASNTLSLTINPSTSGGDVELEPNETSTQATPLSLPGKRNGSVAVGDAAYWVVNYQDGTRDALEDFFALTVTQSSIVELKLTAANAAADLDLFLFKEENQSLSYLGYSVAGPGLEERIVTSSALAPGRYLVAVSAFSGSSSYTLTTSMPDSRLLSLNFNNTLNGQEGESPQSSTGVNFSQGIRGAGLSLPAGNQLFYGSAGNINSAEGTIELWIKPNWNGNDSKHHYILQHGNAGGLLIGKDSANNLRLILNRYGAAGGAELDTGINIADWRANQWQHIAFTWSGSQKSIRIYVNGVLKSSRSFNQTLPTINSDRIRIGGDGNSGFLEAVIDEMGIYNVALSANQILARSQTP